MPSPRARAATSWPMRPKPTTASVLSADSTPDEAAALPAPCAQRRVRLRDVARERQHQGDRVLGRREHVRLRRVADDARRARSPRRRRRCRRPCRRGRRPAAARPRRAARRRPGSRAHDERVVVADPLEQLGAVEAGPDVDLGTGRAGDAIVRRPAAARARSAASTRGRRRRSPRSTTCPAASSSTSSAARPRQVALGSIAPNAPTRQMLAGRARPGRRRRDPVAVAQRAPRTASPSTPSGHRAVTSEQTGSSGENSSRPSARTRGAQAAPSSRVRCQQRLDALGSIRSSATSSPRPARSPA